MSNLNLLVWLRKNKPNKIGKCPLYVRVSLEGNSEDRAEISTGDFIDISQWEYEVIRDGKKEIINEQKVLHPKGEAKTINDHLDNIKNKLKGIFNRLEEKEEIITPSIIKEIYKGNSTAKKHTLVKSFDAAITEMRELVKSKQKKETTVDRYTYTASNVKHFIKHQYGKDDIYLKDMLIRGKSEFSFAADYEHYGKTVTHKDKIKVWTHNYCKKELSRINTMLITAVRKGWLDRNPFEGVSMKTKKGKPKYLTSEQVDLIELTPLHSETLERIRDVFIFCCYTGLSYAEVKKLNIDCFAYGIEGNDWIFIERKKTEDTSGKICKIPLVERPIEILKKYEEDPFCLERGVSLPVLSNKCYNEYLKIIQNACNEYAAQNNIATRINGKFSTHIPRHTCSRYFLDLGYSKEFVAEMFGHTTTKLIGEIYGEITPKRMSLEIEHVRKRQKAS